MVALCKRACMLFTDPLLLSHFPFPTLLSLSLFLPPSLLIPTIPSQVAVPPLTKRRIPFAIAWDHPIVRFFSGEGEGEGGKKEEEREDIFFLSDNSILSLFSLSSLSLVNCVRTGVLSQVHEILWK